MAATATATAAAPANGAEALLAVLESAGVEQAFGLPGVHNLPLWAALQRSGIRLVGVRHEQTAVYAADGSARATGRLGVAITTTGPGAANALGATGEAMESKSPVLVIATDIAAALRRPGVHRGVLHETRDQAGMFAPVVKAALRVTRVEELPVLAAEAIRIALAPSSGPVYLEIPTDLLKAPLAAGPEPAAGSLPSRLGVGPEPAEASATEAVASIDEVAALLAGAERPLIWAGGGALRGGAGDAVGRLATALAAPVIETYLGRGLMPLEHPCRVGLPPHVPEVGALWDEADVVVAVGTDFDGMMTQNWLQPRPPRLVVINVDPADGTKNYGADAVLVGEAADLCGMLARRLEARDGVQAVGARLAQLREEVMARLEAEHPEAATLLSTVRDALPAEAVLFCDMCIPGYWLGAFHPVAGPRKLGYPMGWGTLGFGFPASLGAALAQPAPVLSVCGDGGFLFACGELATAAQDNIPVTVLLVDDGGYGMLRFDQRLAGEDTFGTELHTPDFVALATAFGVEAEEVEDLGTSLAGALERHLSNGRPSMIVVRAALDPPPTTSPSWYRRRA
ncbi:MAG: 5-guanidino-2-oxopentanoate decarboxylase [Thermoleophilaceae bacterium]|jgi:acetolactate synthase-1/2/3 large subunit|nr:5-guanidino-2-oxopentanoate decarboxylase [Thermoleophilaceae bacterium]